MNPRGIIEAIGWEHDPTPWTRHAACIGSDPELFFPERGGSTTEAKAVCQRCTVTDECLAYALRWNIQHGIWGGLGEPARRKLARPDKPRRLPAPHGTTTRAKTCSCLACRDAHWRYEQDRRSLFESDHARTQDVRPRTEYL